MIHTKAQAQAPMTRRPFAQWVVIGLTIAALMLAVIATGLWLVNFFTVYIPMGMLGIVPWMYLTLVNTLCAAGAWLLLAPRLSNSTHQLIWVTQGVFLGAIFVGVWSMGPAFLPSWLLLLVGAIINYIRFDKVSILGLALRFAFLTVTGVIAVGLLLAISAAIPPPVPPPPTPNPPPGYAPITP